MAGKLVASFAMAGILASILTGCAASHTPQNRASPLFSPQQTAPALSYVPQKGGLPGLGADNPACPNSGEPDFIMPFPKERRKARVPDNHMRYSMGDRFNITALGSEDFSGDYVINADGRVILPFAEEILAAGLTNQELAQRIEYAFIKAGIFSINGLRLTVRPVQYAPITISVSGAVFQPGMTTINNIKDSDKSEKVLSRFGDAPMDRFISSAMKAAGGVRPDADVGHIMLYRDGKSYALNWRGAFTGEPVNDVPLIAGDRIVVPEAPCFQSGLMRPSQITPPGIHVGVSNITGGSGSSAGASNLSAGGVAYGTRLLAALVSASCVGGSLASNAQRHAILITRNPKTRQTEVMQRSVEELVQSPNRDAINPFLMPDDSIACYDGTVMDVREAATTAQVLFGTVTAEKLMQAK